MLIVMYAYKNKAEPKMQFGLTLNAIVSILATASQSSLAFTTASAIGQLKWCWLTKNDQTLDDLQTFKDASRGPLGSLSMLFATSIKFKPLASIGAAIVILALAYDPFVQQVLQYPSRRLST